MSIRVLSPGLLTTVQDAGRFGWQAFGVPVSGAMDLPALTAANLLLGNDKTEAALEFTMLGPKLEFLRDECICITGGDFAPAISGEGLSVPQPLPRYAAVAVKAGQILNFSTAKAGCRGYLAFAGGLDISPVLGSRSTYQKAAMGGWQGRALKKGDELPLRAAKASLPDMAWRAISAPRPALASDGAKILRVVLGPQDDAFTQKGMNAFLHSAYTLTPQADRMGCRLQGETIEHKETADIISDGIAFGAVQVPASGQPIIMMADRQTVGGYTKIATVISADLPAVAQARPGELFRFKVVSVQEAQELYLAARNAENSLSRRFMR